MIYFVNFGDDTLKAYLSLQERLDDVNDYLSLSSSDEERKERLESIVQYEFTLDQIERDDNLVCERDSLSYRADWNGGDMKIEFKSRKAEED